MLRLNVSDVDLDLYQDEAVNLTVQFSDLEGINSPVGSFSQRSACRVRPRTWTSLGRLT